VGLAPACGEFEALLAWRGPRFTTAVLGAYDGNVDEGDMEWLRQRAIHVALGNLTYGRLTSKRPYVRAGLHGLERLLPPAAPAVFG